MARPRTGLATMIHRLLPPAAFCAAYVGAGVVGQGLALIPGVAAIFWPPVGVLLGVLLSNPRATWPRWILLGGVAELTWNALRWHNPPALAAAYFCGNALETVTAAWLILRFQRGPFRLETLRELGLLAVFGAVAGASIGASVIGLIRAATGQNTFLETWPLAWLGDASGLIVATPLVVVAIDAWRRRGERTSARTVEAVLTAAALLGVTAFAMRAHPSALFGTLPPVLWAALRFHLRGAAVAVGALTVLTALLGPGLVASADASQHAPAALLQTFLGVTAASAVLVATLSLERRDAERLLTRANALLESRVVERTAALAERERQLEVALAAAAEADRRKDEFLAMLGHELRNPLAPIRNAIEWLDRTAGDEPRAQRVLPMLRRQTAQLGRLVDDLLDVARIAQGRLTLDVEIVDVAEIVAHAAEAVQPLVLARRQTLSITGPSEPAYVRGDGGRLVQCVANLLTNASKYSDAERRISVEVDACRDEVLVSVHDEGSGMSQELLSRAFEPFVQGRRTLDSAHGGLGIGLALVRRLVELHGGSVTATSPGEGRGSSFAIRLPRHAAAGAAAARYAS
jgi:signal transduction histidine kinase